MAPALGWLNHCSDSSAGMSISASASPPGSHAAEEEETGDRRQERGDRREETGDRRQETGDRRQETK
jgi:hypothetical protein